MGNFKYYWLFNSVVDSWVTFLWKIKWQSRDCMMRYRAITAQNTMQRRTGSWSPLSLSWLPCLGSCKTFQPKPNNIDEPKKGLQLTWDDLPQNFVNKALLSFVKRLCACVIAEGGGGHFEHVLRQTVFEEFWIATISNVFRCFPLISTSIKMEIVIFIVYCFTR